MDAADRAREQLGHRKHRHIGQAFLVCERDGVGNHDFFDVGGLEAFDGGAGEYAVRGAAEDIARALFIALRARPGRASRRYRSRHRR